MTGILRARIAAFSLHLIAGLIGAGLLAADQLAADDGMLSDNLRIESAKLGYALQYRVYVPPGYKNAANLPTLYITDGQWYLSEGELHKEIDEQIKKGAIEPVIAVFIDNRNPDNLRQNRRNQQFFCVKEYAEFFRHELVPTITKNYRVSDNRTSRVILGVSFGGLNAGCFGIMAHDVFGGIAMQSPAMHPVPSLQDAYEKEAKRPIKIFLSAGDENEITRRSQKLKRTLEKKGYPVMFKKNRENHNWRNWRPMLDDILIYFFKKQHAATR